MRIGDLAREAGVTPRTIRYYESMGLMEESPRSPGAFRRYTQQDVERLRKIDALKKLGLDLEEIRSVIGLYFSDPTGIRGKEKVLAILHKHLEEVDSKLAALKGFRKDLLSNIERMEELLRKANAGG
ncbi:MerR family transcriptional regulator [Archangium violaceum]|uniref:MerR family transcriptional regulator n=1 Tax=Archangium violaceum TaxID=83451 RepID=UPI00193B94A9|nr:MerR family transcriptional regulator [Archangium violaceum]QRK08427.1 MerR family transcriptional regulator [Archangium violaceum]